MDWNPTQFFFETARPTTPYAILVLNQPINENAFSILKKHASFIVCADGGANRYFDMMRTHGKESVDLPNAIIGDLDSITESVRSHYEKLHVPVIHDEDQYSTDFTKCLRFLRDWYLQDVVNVSGHRNGSNDNSNKNKTLNVLILGGLGGRVDQAFSQIHHLYSGATTESQGQNGDGGAASNHTTTLKLYLVSEESITFILHRGKNIIHTPGTNRPNNDNNAISKAAQAKESEPTTPKRRKTEQEKEIPSYYLEENTGIIPLFGPTKITTSGFEWDVTDWPTQIGGQISTSNHIRADVVIVQCEGPPVLFTVELAGRFKIASGGSGC